MKTTLYALKLNANKMFKSSPQVAFTQRVPNRLSKLWINDLGKWEKSVWFVPFFRRCFGWENKKGQCEENKTPTQI